MTHDLENWSGMGTPHSLSPPYFQPWHSISMLLNKRELRTHLEATACYLPLARQIYATLIAFTLFHTTLGLFWAAGGTSWTQRHVFFFCLLLMQRVRNTVRPHSAAPSSCFIARHQKWEGVSPHSWCFYELIPAPARRFKASIRWRAKPAGPQLLWDEHHLSFIKSAPGPRKHLCGRVIVVQFVHQKLALFAKSSFSSSEKS